MLMHTEINENIKKKGEIELINKENKLKKFVPYLGGKTSL